MSLHEFKRNDYFHNVLKAHPRTRFFLYDGKTFYNENIELSGAFHGEVGHKSAGEISLYEINVDRHSGKLVYPFVTKDGDRNAFSTISTSDFNSNYGYGDQLTGSYPLTSSLHIERHLASSIRTKITALKNTIERYSPSGQHYAYSSSIRDLSKCELSLLSVPSIFYGNSIKKGSVVLRYYLTGNLLAEARDDKQDGALYQVLPETEALGSGSIVGTVLYNEGFVILTASTDLSNNQYLEDYKNDGSANDKPSWTYFGQHATLNKTSSYELEFSGTTKTNVLTMLAHAKSGDLNFSTNPTFFASGSEKSMTEFSAPSKNKVFYEYPRTIKNIVSSSYHDMPQEHEDTVYISKIGIYDERKNLIAIAKLANPVRKRLNDEYTFKLKLDI